MAHILTPNLCYNYYHQIPEYQIVECMDGQGSTLPGTNMEIQKRPYKDYSPSKRGLYGFPCYPKP